MNASCGNAPKANRSSLDNEYTSARKRYRRVYHRTLSGLERGGSIRFVTLTSAPNATDFQRDFRKLIMRLKRRRLVCDYIRVPERTKSGLRHDHILFRGSYIEQRYLSFLWEKLHGSRVVDIRALRSKRAIASYLAKYIAKSIQGRYSYSWGWVWRGLGSTWEIYKKCYWLIKGNLDSDYLTLWRKMVKLRERPKEVGTWLRENILILAAQGAVRDSAVQLALKLSQS